MKQKRETFILIGLLLLTVYATAYRTEASERTITEVGNQIQNLEVLTSTKAAAISFAGGNGTQASPYLIALPEHLESVRNFVGRAGVYFKQTSDIDLSGIDWVPIGTEETSFMGNYDGDGHVIKNLKTTANSGGAGLFGTLSGAEIKGIGFQNGQVTGNGIPAGALAGIIERTTIQDCYNESCAVEITGAASAGGLIGKADTVGNSYLQYVYNWATVKATGGNGYYVGGIIGDAGTDASTIKNSYNRGVLQSDTTREKCGVKPISGNKGGISTGYYVIAPGTTTFVMTEEDSGQTESTDETLRTDATANVLGWNFYYPASMPQDQRYPRLRAFYRMTGGTGTKEDPYQVTTPEDLDSVRLNMGSSTYYVQTTDIDMSAYKNFIPIGGNGSLAGTSPFSGNYEGQGHAVKNLTINLPGSYSGLFGMASGAVVKNVGLSGGSITGGSATSGGVVGRADGCRITGCYNEGCPVTGGGITGGVVGWLSDPGQNPSVVMNCYNLATVHGGAATGGIVGNTNYASQCTIASCYNAGDISAGVDAGCGPVVGYIRLSTITACYYDNTKTYTSQGGLVNSSGEGRSTAEMQSQQTVADLGSAFRYVENDYPRLGEGVHLFAGGAGTKENPYLVSNPEELNRIRDYLSCHFRQIADIDMSGITDFLPLGSLGGAAGTVPFTGSYDGDGYTIKNLTMTYTAGYSGLFGYTVGAEFKNIGLVGGSMTGGSASSGGLIGRGDGVVIDCCYNEGHRVAGKGAVGGIIAFAWGTGSETSDITNCYNQAEVSSTGGNAGGVVGITSTAGTNRIIACYNTGSVTGGNADEQCGPIIGYNINNIIQSCYYDESASYTNIMGGTINTFGEACSTEVLKSLTAVQNLGDAYQFIPGWYPRLKVFGVSFPAGDGSAGNPYLIATAQNLYRVREYLDNPDVHFKQIADIDLAAYPYWEPIGVYSSSGFQGTYDGDGHVITNLSVNLSQATPVGLFGYIKGGIVKNLGIRSGKVSNGVSGAGAFAGAIEGGALLNCYNQGCQVASASHTGGLVGIAVSEGYARIENCYNQAKVSYSGSKAANYCVSGLVGNGTNSNAVSLQNCYHSGILDPGTQTGVTESVYIKISPISWRAKVSNCYYDSDTIGASLSDESIKEATAKTTAQMQAPETANALGYAFTYVEHSYPILGEGQMFSGGAGTQEDPWLITSADELNRVRNYEGQRHVYFEQTTDIDLSSYPDWVPIGSTALPFMGTYDGGGYTVKNLTYKTVKSGWYAGLFGSASDACIKNLGLAGGEVTSLTVSGGALLGRVDSGTVRIQNCYNESCNVLTGYSAGGLLGYTSAGASAYIENCYNQARVESTGGSNCGGISGGGVTGDTFKNCYNTGAVIDTSNRSTGPIRAVAGGTIINCYYDNQAEGVAAYKCDVGNDQCKGYPTATMRTPEIAEALGNAYAYTAGAYPKLGVRALFEKGSGTAEDPYIIATAADLARIEELSDIPGLYYKQAADIDLSTVGDWVPIGTTANPFRGTYDGDGHIIENLKMTRNKVGRYSGLFGSVGDSEIKNVGMVGGSIYSPGISGGALVGSAVSGKLIITGCYNESCQVYTGYAASGLAGGSMGGHVVMENCYNLARVESAGGSASAGLCTGGNKLDSFTNCYNAGVVINTETRNKGPIRASTQGTIKNCYYDSEVEGSKAYNIDINEANCIAKTTAQLKSQASVTALDGGTATDTPYYFAAGKYPLLKKFIQTTAVPKLRTNLPANVSTAEGNAASFTVETLEGLPAVYTYRWYKFGNPNVLQETVDTANTQDTYTISNVSAEDAGQYYCEVSNTTGLVLSSRASLSVYERPQPPYFINISRSANIWGNTAVTFEMTGAGAVTGGQRLQYRLSNADTWTDYTGKSSITNTKAQGILTVEGRALNIGAPDLTSEINTFQARIDMVAPVISKVDVPTAYTTGSVTVTVTANDGTGGSGLAASAYSFDSGKTWQAANTKAYTSNGTIAANTIQVRDGAGNITKYNKAVVIQTIDKEPPVISEVTSEPAAGTWTSQPVTLTIKAADAKSGIHKTEGYSFDNGKTWQADSSKSIDKNGDVQIKVKDQLGNISATYTVNVANIDLTPPTATVRLLDSPADKEYSSWIEQIVYNLFYRTKKVVEIEGADKESPVAKIEYLIRNKGQEMTLEQLQKPDLSWTAYKGQFDLVPTNTYVVYAKVTNEAGLSTIVSSNGIIVDDQGPVVNITGNPTEWKRGSAVIQVTATDTPSGLDQKETYQFDQDQWQTTNTKTYTENIDNASVTVKDRAGNTTTTKFSITKLDNTPPQLQSVTGNPTSWTQSAVSLKVTAQDTQSGLHPTNAYSFDNGVTWQANGTYQVTENTTLYVKIQDAVGNITDTAVEITVDKIDGTDPEMWVSIPEDPGYPDSITWQQGKHIKVKAVDTQSGVASISITPPKDSGLEGQTFTFETPVTGTDGCEVTSKAAFQIEGVYTIQVTDAVGHQQTSQIELRQIDTIAPQTKDFQMETSGEEGNLNVYFKAADIQKLSGDITEYGAGIVKAQYAQADNVKQAKELAEESWTTIGGTTPAPNGWTSYSFTLSAQEAEKNYYVRVTDAVGNVSEPALVYESRDLIHVSVPTTMMYAVLPNQEELFYAPDYRLQNLSSLNRVKVRLTGNNDGTRQEFRLLPGGEEIAGEKELRLYLTRTKTAGGLDGNFAGMTDIVLHSGTVETELGILDKNMGITTDGSSSFVTLKADLYPYSGSEWKEMLRNDFQLKLKFTALIPQDDQIPSVQP